MSSRKYQYKIKNVNDVNALTSAIKKYKGVEDCYVEADVLYYVLDEHTDEYDIMVEANELCAKYGGELIIEEEVYFEEVGGDESDADFVEKPADSTAKPENEGEEDSKEGDEAPQKPIVIDDDYNYQDRLVVSKQTVRKDTIIRVCELALSAILLIVCFLLPDSQDQTLSAKILVGIFAFAIGGYEIFYSAITDMAHKKLLTENVIMAIACLLGAFIGYVIETTALALVFSIAKEIEIYANAASKNKFDEIFYTGSVAITTESGDTKKLADIAVNDVLLLNEFDIIPCDGVAKNTCVLDCYRSLGVPEMTVNEGDKIYAGSVVLSEKLQMVVEKTNAESNLTKKKNAFEEKLSLFTKPNTKLTYVNIALVVASLLLAFIPPIFGKTEYLTGLQLWGARAVTVLSISTVSYAFYLAASCIRNALITLKYQEIEVNKIETFNKVAEANCFKFKSSTLTEEGKMKPDTYGVMNELLAIGAKNVETEFDNDLSEDERAKIDFVQKPVSKKREATVGTDITLSSGGDIAIETGEISFVPVAYKIAKRANKRKKAAICLKIVSFIAIIAALALVPVNAINPIYYGVINGAITALFALFSLSIIKTQI